MKKFRQNIYEISQLDILTLTTAASIGESIMIKEGAFDDVVDVTGVVRDVTSKPQRAEEALRDYLSNSRRGTISHLADVEQRDLRERTERTSFLARRERAARAHTARLARRRTQINILGGPTQRARSTPPTRI